jgi:YVTN family beta-propeller protein
MAQGMVAALLFLMVTSTVVAGPVATGGMHSSRAPERGLSADLRPLATGLTVFPTSGAPGTTVAISGSGFSANTTINLTFAGIPVNSTCSTDSAGDFPGDSGTPCTFTVPTVPGGTETVFASSRSWNLAGTVPVGDTPIAVAYDSGVNEVFVANTVSGNVSVISDASDSVVASVTVGEFPFGIAYDPGKGEVFVANRGSDNVSVISDSSNSVIATIPVGSGPFGVTYDSGLGEVCVTNTGSNNVSVISDTSDSVIASVAVGSYPFGAAYDPGTGNVFVTNQASASVSVIADSNNSLVTTVPVGSGPYGVAYDSGPGELFVANSNSNNVSVISDVNDSVVGTIAVGGSPIGVATSPALGAVFVTNQFSNNVSVLTDSNGSVIASVRVGTNPYGVAYDVGRTEVFVTNAGSDNVSIISNELTGTATFSVSANLTLHPVSADVGQTVTVQGSGFGNELSISTFTLGPYALSCSTAIVGTCTGGALTSAPSGALNATFLVPSVADSGPFNVSLWDTDGNNATAAISVFTNHMETTPDASVPSVDLGQSVTFNTTSSFGSGGDTYVWLNLPTGCGGNQSIVPCTPTAVGNFSVSVEITDSNNVTVTIGPLLFPVFHPPTADLSADRTDFDLGQSVTLTVQAGLGSGGYTYAWAGLPTGCSGASATIACAPADPGTFPVTVQVADSNGVAVGSPSVTLSVAPSLSVNLSASTTSPGVGDNVRFTSNATGGTGPLSYAWEFGDGSSASGAIVEHNFSTVGYYTVALWVNDSGGGSVEKSVSVSVQAAPPVTPPPSTAPPPAMVPYELILEIAVVIIFVAAALILLRRRRGGGPTPPLKPADPAWSETPGGPSQ